MADVANFLAVDGFFVYLVANKIIVDGVLPIEFPTHKEALQAFEQIKENLENGERVLYWDGSARLISISISAERAYNWVYTTRGVFWFPTEDEALNFLQDLYSQLTGGETTTSSDTGSNTENTTEQTTIVIEGGSIPDYFATGSTASKATYLLDIKESGTKLTFPRLTPSLVQVYMYSSTDTRNFSFTVFTIPWDKTDYVNIGQSITVKDIDVVPVEKTDFYYKGEIDLSKYVDIKWVDVEV